MVIIRHPVAKQLRQDRPSTRHHSGAHFALIAAQQLEHRCRFRA